MENPGKPAAVTIIGMLYILFGALLAFGAALRLALMKNLPPFHPFGALTGPRRQAMMDEGGGDILFLFDLIDGVFVHRDVITAAALAVGAAAVVGAAGFLRLRPWGRWALEALTWLALAGALGMGLFWLWMMLSIRGAALPEAEWMAEEFPFTPRLFGSLMMVFGAVLTLIHSVIPAVFIWLLRTKSVREAMRRN